MSNVPKHGSLRIYWFPQVPCKPFHWPVADLIQARTLLDCLAQYDLFQLANNIKPDYANAGGLNVFDATDKTMAQTEVGSIFTATRAKNLTITQWQTFLLVAA